MSVRRDPDLGRQVFRFLLTGGLAAAINWLVRFPLSMVLPMPWAILGAYVIGMSAGYHLYRSYVFERSDRSIRQQIAAFIAVNLAGAVVVLGLTYGFVALQPDGRYPEMIREGIAHGFAIGIGAIVNFLGHKFLTFRQAGARRLPFIRA